MSQQSTPPTANPELEILLIEERIIDLQGKVVTAQNNLHAAQDMRERSDPGSANESIAEVEIEDIHSYIDSLNAEIERLETERRKLQIQISDRLRGR